MSQTLIAEQWDYTRQAKYYQYRPNYSARAIDMLIRGVSANLEATGYRVLDVGAGTGNLTIMLLERGLRVVAIEPNDSMREIGIERTNGQPVQWVKANGIETGQPDDCYDWVTFGSSFNVMDRTQALKETHRVLKSGGFFSCLWNHRNLDDPIQSQCEQIIEKLVPNYERGVRREDQRPTIEQSGLFTDVFYLEVDTQVLQAREDYLDAWRSVRNRFWDTSTPEGAALLETILDALRAELAETVSIRYTTRAWTARKIA